MLINICRLSERAGVLSRQGENMILLVVSSSVAPSFKNQGGQMGDETAVARGGKSLLVSTTVAEKVTL